MTQYACIKEGVVTNVVLWDGESPYPGGDLVLIEDTHVGIGWSRVDDEWVAPEPVQTDPPEDPNMTQKLAAAQKLMDDFGFTEEMARAVVGI